MTDAPATVSFEERLWFGPVGWGSLVGLAAVAGIAVLPIDGVLAAVLAIVALVVFLVLAVVTTTRVAVADGTLRAGSAHIPLNLLGEVRELDKTELHTELGPRLDARAYLCTRGWVSRAVRVEVVDPADPTPYWVISSRRPDELAEALRAR